MSDALEAAPCWGVSGVVKPHPRILIADDDPSTGRMLQIVLGGRRCKVDWCRSGRDALHQAIMSRPDAVVLELDLPDGDGIHVLESLREWTGAPVIILTGRAEIAQKVHALDAGANDYMVKPFAPEELAARLRVLLRSEPAVGDGPLLASGPLRIDMATRTMTLNGLRLVLTATEEALLYILARHVGKLVPRRRLIRAIWGMATAGKGHDLQVHIAHLRRKLEAQGGENLIQGEGGFGYRLSLFDPDNESPVPDALV
jgi:two-component system, OmpR family, KDP operon response regulator KdpE